MAYGLPRRLRLLLGLVVALGLLLGALAARTDAAGAARCRTAQLRLDAVGGQGFTSHREVDFALRNMSSRTCSLRGYPGAAWLGGSAQPLAEPVDRAPGRAVRTVVLAPFGRAFFSFVYVVAGPCVPHAFVAYGMEFTPPGATRSLRFYAGRTAVCAATVGGAAQVTPVQATHP